MPLLGGFFGRKNRSSSRSSNAGTNVAASDLGSTLSSPTNSYVTPDKSLPSSPNGNHSLHPDAALKMHANTVYPSISAPSSSSSSKLRLPFSRKKSSATAASATSTISAANGDMFNTSPRPAYLSRLSTSTMSDAETAEQRRLRPPPSKSAFFAAYNDPTSALSTRSLPNNSTRSNSGVQSTPPPPMPSPRNNHSKRPSIFPWAKSPNAPLKSSVPDFKPLPDPLAFNNADSSFSLKSFRNVRAPSPNASDISLTAPVPRPRGASVNSESSQRISVAAFREAQAKRSLAGSPSPSFRSPSPGLPPSPFTEYNRGTPSPRPARSPPHIQNSTLQNRTKRLSMAALSSESEEQSSSEEEESDDDVSHQPGILRRRTVTQRSNNSYIESRLAKGRAKSEMGHGSSHESPLRPRDMPPPPRSQSAYLMGSQQEQQTGVNSFLDSPPPRSQSSLGMYGRQRASNSASALAPSAAAKRASVVATTNAGSDALSDFKHASRHIRDSSTYSNPDAIPKPTVNQPKPLASALSSDSDSDSEDDAPLATLVAPRRPGSALSSYSNGSQQRLPAGPGRSSTNLPQKPLIDIKELTGGVRPPTGLKSPSVNSSFGEGFNKGATLLSRPLVESPTGSAPSSPISPLISKVPPTRFISPPSSPPKEVKAFIIEPSVPEAKKDRDMINERLTRVVKQRVSVDEEASSASVLGRSSSPFERRRALSPPRDVNEPTKETGLHAVPRPVSPKARQQVEIRGPASDVRSVSTVKNSPPDEDLARMLGGGIRLISRNGESDMSDSDEDSYGEEEETKSMKSVTKTMDEGRDVKKEEKREPDRIAPIPIKQRAPPPSFSVTSRPAFPKNTSSSGSGSATSSTLAIGIRQRSSTLIPSPTSSSSFGVSTSSLSNSRNSINMLASTSTSIPKIGSSNSSSASGSTSSPTIPGTSQANTDRANALKMANSSSAPRQRSTTMVPKIPAPVPSPPKPSPKPFVAIRRDSPASSTGDSSSGRAPLTPRDGSEISVGIRSRNANAVESMKGQDKERDRGNGTSGVGPRHAKRKSVVFENDLPAANGRVKESSGGDEEERRRERRRIEARAAIELGNVVNGPAPVVNDDDDDDDMPINHTLNTRMSGLNPMMGMGGSMPMQMGFGGAGSPGWGMPGWPQPGQGAQMVSPAQFMVPPPADPAFFAAHRQAMMYAKQAYQIAVAQQAMAAAGDEWERGSTVGGIGGGSVYGGSTNGFNMGMGMNMMGMPMGSGNGWSTGSMIFPSAPRSMYGGGGIHASRSEYGGPTGGRGAGNWSSSRSSYGELGPGGEGKRGSVAPRESGYFPPVPSIPQGSNSAKASSRSRTASQPASPTRPSGGIRKAPPPSSWKSGM